MYRYLAQIVGGVLTFARYLCDREYVLCKAWRIYRTEGISGVNKRLRYLIHVRVLGKAGVARGFRRSALVGASEAIARYEAWQGVNCLSAEAVKALDQELRRGQRLPHISVVMPVFNTPRNLLERAIQSVVAQTYTHWDLCVADDASSDGRTIQVLREWEMRSSQISVRWCANNGNISRATNIAAESAKGDYLVFLDHDDEITPDALAEVAAAVVENGWPDYIYSDDDKIDVDGRRFAPQFKPTWDPMLLLSHMYLGHIKVVRRSLFNELGGFRLGFEGSQDFDFALRMAERTSSVVHIPKVLYHWRASGASTAVSGDAKPHSFEAGRRAVAEAFARRNIVCEVERPKWAVDAGVGIYQPRFPDSGPEVAIIIATRNHVDLLRKCIASIKKTTYRNYRVVVIDNESDDPETLKYLASLPHRVLRIGNPQHSKFNYAFIHNEAVRTVEAEFVLFLNNDTEVRTAEWLSQMMGYARMPGIAVVGARLLFADDTVQHAGIVHGYYGGLAGSAFRNEPSWSRGYLAYGAVARQCSAVTAACLLTSRALFLESGGFDEKNFAVAYNDVDYCYRLIDAGWRCVYCPTAELYHYEGKTRGHSDNPQEIATFRSRYSNRTDPWYNRNLSLEDEHFRVRPFHRPSPVSAPVRAIMVTHNLNHEGAPNSQAELTIGLVRRKIIDPVVLSPVDGPLRSRYEEAGIPVRIIRSPLLATRGRIEFEQRTAELAALFMDLHADVVYGNTLQTFWAIAAGERARLPTVWNPRESENWETYFDFLAPDLREQAYRCFAYPYRVVFVAEATRRVWAPLESVFNFAVIHNGIDVRAILDCLSGVKREEARKSVGATAGDVVISLVGTVCERKGQLDAVRALRYLDKNALQRARLVIVGDRPSTYSTALHREIRRLPRMVQDRVVVLQENGDIWPFYKAADIFLCTSRIESYPRVILEAMASGLPIITTPVYGIKEQVRENVNASFYRPRDVRSLGSALTTMISDERRRVRLAANSYAVLQSLTTYSEMLTQYGDIFREARYSKGSERRSGESRVRSVSSVEMGT